MKVTLPVGDFLAERGVTRLTHFTNSRNLPSILRAGAILSRTAAEHTRLAPVITDPERLDGRLDHVCCNIQYPNMFYFDRTRTRTWHVNYSDWVIFLLAPALAALPGTLFSPSNAAARNGAQLAAGTHSLARLYADTAGAQYRAPHHLPASPTDIQAEVLVEHAISLSDVLGIVSPSEETMRKEMIRLEITGIAPVPFPWYVSEELFRKERIRSAVRASTPLPLDGPFLATSALEIP